MVNFGDGATFIGAVHEAMNLAGVWKLPVIFVCQNNQIGEYTKIPDYTASPNFAGRADALGFKGMQLDGNDPVAFHKGMSEAVEMVRARNGPVFVEAVTLRLGTHAGFQDNELLTKDELAAGKANWPVPKTRALLSRWASSRTSLPLIDSAAAAEVKEAVDFALAQPDTTTSVMFEDVYADNTVVPRRGVYPVREAEGPMTGETREMGMFEAIISAQDNALEAVPRVHAGRGHRRSAGRRVQDLGRPADQVGQGARASHPDRRTGDHRLRHRRGAGRHASHRRDHVQRFHCRVPRPDRQPCRQAALHVRQRNHVLLDDPRAHIGRHRRGRRAAQPSRSLAAA